jgi:hypothetical protein
LWFAVLSRLERVLVVAIAGARGKRGGCKRDDSGYKSDCDLGRHDHFLLVFEANRHRELGSEQGGAYFFGLR